MSTSTVTAADFTVLKNGIDSRLEVVCHIETGFYNITKTANLVHALKATDRDAERAPAAIEGPRGFPLGPTTKKFPKDWFANASTKELIDELKRQTDLESVFFQLDRGTPNEFKGTYVHRYLYDHFLAWLDSKYAIKISLILDEVHKQANRKIIQEKDDEISKIREIMQQQSSEIKQQSSEIKQQSFEIRELLGHTKTTHAKLDAVHEDLSEARDQIDDLQDDIGELKDEVALTHEQVEIATSYLEEKSFTSTQNPDDEAKHHYFGAMSHSPSDNTQVVTFIAGQQAYFDTRIPELEKQGRVVIIPPFYNANPIDLRQNALAAFIALRTKRIIEINTENERLDKVFNDALKQEISVYNKANPDEKRVFSQEKRKTPKVLVKDIPVKFLKLRFTYTRNEYISFDEVLQIIPDVNNSTQRSPLSSFDEEETKSED